jgi:DNA-binding NarL/FixJ family response regulator
MAARPSTLDNGLSDRRRAARADPDAWLQRQGAKTIGESGQAHGAKTVMVVDDHLIVRRGIISLIAEDPAFTVCAEADDGAQALELAKEARPDIVVLDISLPKVGGIDVAIQLRRIAPEAEILFLTVHDNERIIADALRVGARAYVLKSECDDKLMEALRALARHQPYFAAHVSERLLESYLSAQTSCNPAPLSPRERQIVTLVAEGNSNKAIAALLGVSVKTVETHRGSAMRKIGAKSSAELALYAARHRLVQI